MAVRNWPANHANRIHIACSVGQPALPPSTAGYELPTHKALCSHAHILSSLGYGRHSKRTPPTKQNYIFVQQNRNDNNKKTHPACCNDNVNQSRGVGGVTEGHAPTKTAKNGQQHQMDKTTLQNVYKTTRHEAGIKCVLLDLPVYRRVLVRRMHGCSPLAAPRSVRETQQPRGPRPAEAEAKAGTGSRGTSGGGREQG